MLEKNKDITEYQNKINKLLIEEDDYTLFQEQASLLVKNYHDTPSQKAWGMFCDDLNNAHEKQPVKFLVLKLALQCLEQPASYLQLANLVTLAQDLKSAYGTELYMRIFEAETVSTDRCIENYLILLKLLIELRTVENIVKETILRLPKLHEVIKYLRVVQNTNLEKKFPKRNIDIVLEKFATIDEIVKFPLKKEVLLLIKEDCLGIENHLQQIRALSQEALKQQFQDACALWREQNDAKAKQKMIAILVETVRHFFGIQVYDTQIIALLGLLYKKPSGETLGCLAQIKAGEGKSTEFVLLSAFKAGEGRYVDLVTSSNYLSLRDYQKYSPFFEALGITSSLVTEGKNTQIVYGTSSDYQFAFLRRNLNKKNQPIARPFDVAIFDEIDCLMLDKTGIARIASAGTENYAWVYKPILDFVKEKIKNQPPQSTTVADLRSYLSQKIIAKYQSILTKMTEAQLLKWLTSAQTAYYDKIRNRDYTVDSDIRIIDYKITGQKEEGCEWQDGIHQFLQVKEGLMPTAETKTIASIANPTYFNQYKEKYGASGTLGEEVERNEIKKVYFVEIFDVPPHLPCQRNVLDPKMLPDGHGQYKALVVEIKEMQKEGRPVLILFESIADTLAFSKFLHDNNMNHQLLNGEQRESAEYIVAHAGEKNKVTVATNLAGRGTDILIPLEIQKAGGLHQVFAFYPENSRVEEQGICRGARQGQQGSSRMILHEKDERIFSLLATSLLDIIKWVSINSAKEKIALLNKLRTQKIQRDSKRREYFAQLEGLYFIYLKQFFQELHTLKQRIEDTHFQQQLTQICATELPVKNDCAFPINIKHPYWSAMCRNAKILVTDHILGKHVDWSAFVEEFFSAFVQHIMTGWAQFYSQLSNEVESLDIPTAEKIVQQAYAKLNLSARCSTEIITSTLIDVLHQAISPHETPEHDLATMSLFARKPQDIYKDAVKIYHDTKKGREKYDEALKHSQSALESACVLNGKDSILVADCYAFAASCYRELNRYD